LNNIEIRPIGGRQMLVFLAVAVLLAAFCVPFVKPGQNLFAVLGGFFGIGLLAVIAAVAPMGWVALPALGLRPAGWRPIVFGALGTLALSVAVSQLGIEPKGMKQAMEISREPGLFLMSLFIMGLLAPVVEELMVRGMLFGWLAGRWGGGVAAGVSSLVFAAAHLEPAHVVLVLPLGLLFGWLRWRTGSLLPSMASHIVNNSFAVAASLLVGVD
jgi:membrane protease YdiL (CAAX protease family)